MRLTWLMLVVAGRIGRGKKSTVRNRDTSLERIENSLWVYIIVHCSTARTSSQQAKSNSNLQAVYGTPLRGPRVEQQNRNRQE
jgi:hypothetical protein